MEWIFGQPRAQNPMVSGDSERYIPEPLAVDREDGTLLADVDSFMEKFNSYALQRSMGQQLIEYARRGCHSLVWPTTCVSSSAGAPMIQGNFPLLGSSKAKSTIERCPSKGPVSNYFIQSCLSCL